MNNFNSHRTLILNSTFQPLSVASAKRSVSLLLSNKINVIKKSKLEIRSENKIINIPKVALLTYYVKAPYARRVALNRSNIFIRDFNICQYCGNPKHQHPAKYCELDLYFYSIVKKNNVVFFFIGSTI